MTYATWYINSVEYGLGRKSHYKWDKESRVKFTEKQLAEALNSAYREGIQAAVDQIRRDADAIECGGVD